MSKELTTSKDKYGFAVDEAKSEQSGALAQAQGSKAVQEIQAALTIAMHNPRDENKSYQRIIRACQRPVLADHALYAYPKGGQTVTGPSIRLAEVLAQNWGNISTGVREISQTNGVSEVEAFAWDLETNFQATKIFHVKHERYTKNGSYKITDPREIYELIANNGARRQRACILAVIPGDIVDAAVEECAKTSASGQEPLADRVRKMISAFDELGVKVEHLEKRLGHNMDATIETEIVTLKSIYKSIKDGMASREQFFDIGGPGHSVNGAQVDDHLSSLVAGKKGSNVKPIAPDVKKTVDTALPEVDVTDFFEGT